MAGRTERRSGPSSKRGNPNSGPRKKLTGGERSERQASLADMVGRHPEPTGKLSAPAGGERTFHLVLDAVPYFVKAAPFSFNGETRFSVCINDGREHIFTWDSDLKGLRAIDDESSILPDSLEEAISERLQSKER